MEYAKKILIEILSINASVVYELINQRFDNHKDVTDILGSFEILVIWELFFHQLPTRRSDNVHGSMVTTQSINYAVTVLLAVYSGDYITVQSLCLVGDWWNRCFCATPCQPEIVKANKTY